MILTERSRADVYLEKDVGCWLTAHQLPQQVHHLKYNFDSILKNVRPNCKSENSCHYQKRPWQFADTTTTTPLPPTTHAHSQRNLEWAAPYLQGSEVLSKAQSEFCHSARGHRGVWSLKRMSPLMNQTGQSNLKTDDLPDQAK